jgi:heme A synthase
MRRVYTALAWIIAGAVVVQAAAIAFAFGGILNRLQQGDVVDKALVESGGSAGQGELGFWIHGIVGGVVIPMLAVALFAVSFLVRVRGARLWAAVVLGVVLLQVTLGFSLTDVPYLGLIHGANAVAVVSTATIAALRMQHRGTRRPEGVSRDVVSA